MMNLQWRRLATILLFVFNYPALAITYGQLDGIKHPAVAALIDYYPDHVTPYAYCSGTLISPSAVLTAAHCDPTDPNAVYVTFESQLQVDSQLYKGRFIAHPAYTAAQNDPHDIAVIIFDRPIKGAKPAKLPTLGLFDTLKNNGLLKDSHYTAVGYGGQERNFDGQGRPLIEYLDTREWAVASFNALNEVWLRLSQNQATGDGGTCYGDSGGPNFIGSGANESAVLAGITITGDSQCVATNVIYRLDSQSARAFLQGFVALP